MRGRGGGQTSTRARQINQTKFRGLYVDFTEDGSLLRPSDVTEQQARDMVATAHQVLAQIQPVTTELGDDPVGLITFIDQRRSGLDLDALETEHDNDPDGLLAKIWAALRKEGEFPTVLAGGLAPYLADLDTRRSPARDKASHQRLGASRRRAPGGGRHPKLTLADQITATLLHQHLALPTAVLARLLGVSKDTARHAVNQTQQLLDQHGFTPPPPAAHLTTLVGLSATPQPAASTPQRRSNQRVDYLQALSFAGRGPAPWGHGDSASSSALLDDLDEVAVGNAGGAGHADLAGAVT
jgi:hypothetical protein